jgi:hypothetical protein
MATASAMPTRLQQRPRNLPCTYKVFVNLHTLLSLFPPCAHMTPSRSRPVENVACTAAAENALRLNISRRDSVDGTLQYPHTTHLIRSGVRSSDATVSQTPHKDRVPASVVHTSRVTRDSDGQATSRHPSSRRKITVYYTNSVSDQGLNDETNVFSDSSHAALNSVTKNPPSYAALHNIADDGKTVGCNRTLTFDTFVGEAHVNHEHQSLEHKRRFSDRLRKWMKSRAASLRLTRKPRCS